MGKFLLTTLIIALAFGISSTAQAANPAPEWPAYAYKDGGYANNLYTPSGWMGNFGAMGMYVDAYNTEQSVSGTSTKIGFTGGTGSPEWTGIYWLWPDSNWGTDPNGGWNMTGGANLTFWARGAVGGEKLEFKVGGVSGTYGDTIMPGVFANGAVGGKLVLNNTWTQYTMDLTGKNLSRVVGGFEFAANDTDNPSGATFYVDDVQFNPIPEPTSLLLLGTGLVGLVGFARKRRI